MRHVVTWVTCRLVGCSSPFAWRWLCHKLTDWLYPELSPEPKTLKPRKIDPV
jgi:hypothetical protein